MLSGSVALLLMSKACGCIKKMMCNNPRIVFLGGMS